MTQHRLALALATFFAIASSTVALAQTPPAQTAPQQDEPKAASSPHQRESTSTDAQEAPAGTETSPSAASTPHQKEATEGKVATGKTKAEREQMMSDCMKKQQERNSTMSVDQVRKTCVEQMKSHGQQTTRQE